MAKVLLVEDDNNLREIFAMRLQAEGYETMSAADGEEALVVAMKQKPDLIIADVMMPKLSGFEMLETLRGTPEMADVKVIMMTALGQAEDRSRGEKLGVVKYLVKSQVTLEDFVKVVQEVLQPGEKTGGQPDDQASKGERANKTKAESEKSMDDKTNSNPMPGGDSGMPASPAGGDSGMPAGDGQQSTADEQATVQGQVNDFAGGGAGSDSGSAGGDSGSMGGGGQMPPAGPPSEGPQTPPADGQPDESPTPGTPPAV